MKYLRFLHCIDNINVIKAGFRFYIVFIKWLISGKCKGRCPYRRSVCSAWAPGARGRRRRGRGVAPAWPRIPRRRRHLRAVRSEFRQRRSTGGGGVAATTDFALVRPPDPGRRRPAYFQLFSSTVSQSSNYPLRTPPAHPDRPPLPPNVRRSLRMTFT